MSKKIKKIASIALPIASSFIPGIGPLGAAAIGAGTGALTGGGLKGALLGGLTSAAGNYLSGSGILGQAAGSTLDKVSGIAGLQGPTMGSGILGAASKVGNSLSSVLKGGLSGSGSGPSFGSLSNIASGINSYMTQDDMEEQLLKAQGKAKDAINPFYLSGIGANNQLNERLSAGFNPTDLENDPGYQFRLAEGNKAVERSLAARGLGNSGAALKAAQEYGQGLADQTYNDAYQRWLAQNSQIAGQAGQGYNAASDIAGIYDTEGDVRANATLGKSNVLTGTLSSILSGSGSRQIVGYKPDGTPIYADEREMA